MSRRGEANTKPESVVGPLRVLDLLAPIAHELGSEFFELLLRCADEPNAPEGTAIGASVTSDSLYEWCHQVARAGWGQFRVLHVDWDRRCAKLAVTDPLELRGGSAVSGEYSAACPLTSALVARAFSNLFAQCVEATIVEIVGDPAIVTFSVALDGSNAVERLATLRSQRRPTRPQVPESSLTSQASEARTRELLRQRTRALREEIVAREEAEKVKDEMLATVSHELRTPLTSLRGFTELMRDRDLPPEKQRHCVEIIHNESLRLSHLIDDFLDLQSMERGKDNTAMQAADLGPVLASAAELYSTRSHRVRVTVPANAPLVMADTRRVQQVLNNLLSNAVKFSPGRDAVDLSLEVRDDDVVVRVRDYGLGIPPDCLPKLFAKFYRVDNADTRAIGGTGLGLAITKQIVERHGGSISVDSFVGQGTTFSFTLLRAQARA